MSAGPGRRSALAAVRELLARLDDPAGASLGGWRPVETGLQFTGIETCFEHPRRGRVRLRFSRPGQAPAWGRIGPFDVAEVERSGQAGTGLAAALAGWAGGQPLPDEVRWPAWDPRPPVMVIASGIPRAGTGWVNRLLATMIQATGRSLEDPPGGRDDFSPRGPDDRDGRELAAAIERHRSQPQRVWKCKAHYFTGSPRTDHPAFRTVFVYRDLADVLTSSFFRMQHGPPAGMFRGLAPGQLLERVVALMLPPAREALERIRAGVPATTLVLRYERMLDDAERAAARVAAHLGLTLPGDVLTEIVRMHSFTRESSRAPGEVAEARYHRRGQAGRWREDLEPELARPLEALAPELEALISRVDSAVRARDGA